MDNFIYFTSFILLLLVLLHNPYFEDLRPRIRKRCTSGRNHFSLVNPCHVLLCFLIHLPDFPTISEQEQHHSILGNCLHRHSHIFLSWLLTIKYKFGLAGAMTSTILAYWIPNIGHFIFVTCGWCPETCKASHF